MSSIAELQMVRLYRAYNTVLRMCTDRGYVVRHPSVVAAAMQDANVYDANGDGLSYDWFMQHFVRCRVVRRRRGDGASHGAGDHDDAQDDDVSEGDEETQHDGNGLSRHREREWTAMRQAMRLTCAPRDAVAPATRGTRAVGDGNDEAAAAAAAARQREQQQQTTTQQAAADASSHSKALLVFFVGGSSSSATATGSSSSNSALSIKEVLQCRSKALQKHASSMLIVSALRVPPSVRRDVHELSGRLSATTGAPLLRIQVLEEDALALPPTLHETVPRHTPLRDEAAVQQLLQSRQVTLSQLPRMLATDPMALYLGLSRGTVVHVHRESKESGPYDMFRYIV